MSSAVINKIENILCNPYDTKSFVDLVCEIFPSVRIVAPDKLNKEFSNFSSHIEGSAHVGTFQTPDKKKLIIMAVQLKKNRYVENSRSTHRSFAKKLIENSNADAAFIAFYTPDDPKWRLSLVRLDYEMKIENGRLKAAENLTPAKRYSYLVGKGEPCHTAIRQFERFITDSAASPQHPTLDDLENAFSVEKVTDEFFNLYCEKFHQLRELLEESEDFLIEAKQHNFTSVQFAKKLMGQIVFLYFLQKKGWLGVKAWPDTLNEKEYRNAYYAHGAKSRELIPIVYRPSEDGVYRISRAGLDSISDADEEVLANCVNGMPWGSGPHNFMRILFDYAIQRNINFFDKLLEPLFYDALNRNRGEQGYCPALHCRIPFLSGGLFEPIDGYDWKHNDFSIPNTVFSNIAEKGKREADGILDIFDRYNFTMSEDEPMEREVAIDPEMLGKVFENLLEVKDRKSKGAFYTPREIVHYMCQESLINYLTNTMKVDEEAIRDFILYGDFMKDQDTVKTLRVADKSGNYHMEFDFNKELYISEQILSFKNGVNRLAEMDNALKNVRVADPAVGSGAFPLGMLNEIVRARQNISAYMSITMNPFDVRMMYQMERSPHTLKYETIRNCIFAADIEPSAVDIAQLRLWLALVIDDEINPNAQSPLDGHRNPLALPNLESNILCGNSLIDEFEGIRLVKESDLFRSATYQTDLSSGRFDSIVSKLIDTQDELFRCEDTEKKKRLKEQIAALKDMVIMTQLEGCDSDKIQRYLDTTKAASKPYVLWQLDFARVFREKGGFDIVIGNPPYGVKYEPDEKKYLKRHFTYSVKGKFESYRFFMEFSEMIANKHAILSYVVPNTWMSVEHAIDLRKYWLSNFGFRSIIQFPQKSFGATVDTIAYVVDVHAISDNTTVITVPLDEDASNITKYFGNSFSISQNTWLNTPKHLIIFGADIAVRNLIDSILDSNPRLGDVVITKQGLIPYLTKEEGKENKFISKVKKDNQWKPYFDGSRCVDRYGIKGKVSYILYGDWLYAPREKRIFCQQRIIFQLIRNISLKRRIVATLLEDEVYSDRNTGLILKKVSHVSLKYVLGLLNSNLFNFIHANTHNSTYISFPSIEALPYIEPTDDIRMKMEGLVTQILEIKKQSIKADTSVIEKEIDEIVYTLFRINANARKLIESGNK